MSHKNIKLTDATIGYLDHIHNASQYLENIVNLHWQRSSTALETLRAAGWHKEEVMACCELLNGLWYFIQPPAWQAASMEDGPEYAEKWDIPDERWKELTQQISSRSEVSFALDIVVSEFWSANTHFESMIKKLPSVEEEETR